MNKLLALLMLSTLTSCNWDILGLAKREKCGIWQDKKNIYMKCGNYKKILAKAQKGVNGQDGIDGTNGINGLNGSDGINGSNGNNGSSGAQGIQGIAGIDGQNGNDGNDGAKGDKGDQGNPGIDGSDGADGTDGHDGRDGVGGRWGFYKNGVKLGTILPIHGFDSQSFIVSDNNYLVAMQIWNRLSPVYSDRWSIANYYINSTWVNGVEQKTITRSAHSTLRLHTTSDCSDSGRAIMRSTIKFGYKQVTLGQQSNGDDALYMPAENPEITSEVLDNLIYIGDAIDSPWCQEIDEFLSSQLVGLFHLVVENDPAVTGFDTSIIDVPISENEIK